MLWDQTPDKGTHPFDTLTLLLVPTPRMGQNYVEKTANNALANNTDIGDLSHQIPSLRVSPPNTATYIAATLDEWPLSSIKNVRDWCKSMLGSPSSGAAQARDPQRYTPPDSRTPGQRRDLTQVSRLYWWQECVPG